VWGLRRDKVSGNPGFSSSEVFEFGGNRVERIIADCGAANLAVRGSRVEENFGVDFTGVG